MALSSLPPGDFERQLHCTTSAYTLNTSNFLFWIWRFNSLPPKHLHISYINVTSQSFFFLSIQKVEHRQKFEERRNCLLVFSQTAVCFKRKHTINRLNIYFFFHLWPSQSFIHMLAFGRFSTILTQALLQLNKPSVSHEAWPCWCPRPVLWELASFLA